MRALAVWPQVLALAAGLLTAKTVAAEQVHTVVAGESAASLAKKYYGDADLGTALLRFNGKPGKLIHPGERLTIPFCEVYRAKPGDTWSVLAKRHLGRAKTASVLAELNGYSAGEPLRVGARIVFPVVLRHTLARGETLAILAERFYGDAKRAKTLQEFGRIDDAKRLAVGTPLEIPVVTFLRREPEPQAAVVSPPPQATVENAIAAPPVPEAAATPAPPPADERRFEELLVAAKRSFDKGNYDQVREVLEGMRERVAGEGGPSDRREWSQLMAFVYIALDRDDDACIAYRSGSPAGAPALDPDLISPRIRAVLSNCASGNSSAAPLDHPAPPAEAPPAGMRG